MHKNLIRLSVLVFIISIGFNYPAFTADASAVLKPFGGKILATKALEVTILENTGFICVILGKTIEIKPAGAFPLAYLIPAGVISKTHTTPAVGQQIKGLYSGIKIPIVCTNSGVTKTVNLPSVTLWGTSIK